MRTLVVVVILLFGLILFRIPATIAQQSDYLIVPGQRLGRWELGKPLGAYEFGQPARHTEQKVRDAAWSDFYTFAVGPEKLNLWVYTCKADSLVFALMTARPIGRSEMTEATKYKTSQGIGIDTEEAEILRVLGRPPNASDSRQSVDGAEVTVKTYDYPGLRIRVPQSDHKVHALGATTQGGFAACQQAVIGGPALAQRVTMPLPVPMPANLRIKPPASDVPPNRAAFSGVWVGKWNNTLDTALAVSEIKETTVSVIYAWGAAPGLNIDKPGHSRGNGQFAGSDELQVQVSVQKISVLIVFRMRPDGRLDGEYTLRQPGPKARQTNFRAILTKVFP